MLTYLILISLNLTLCYLSYKWMLEHLVMHNFKRVYLLLSLTLSVTLPAFSFSFNTSIPDMNLALERLNEITLNSNVGTTETAPFVNWTVALFTIYLFGVGFRLIKTALSIYKLVTLKRQGQKIRVDNQLYVILDHIDLPFTFLNTIYLPRI